MEEIIKELIEIDSLAKSMVNKANKDAENADQISEQKIEEYKNKIDEELILDLNNKKERLDKDFETEKEKIINDTNYKLVQIDNNFQNNKAKLVDQLMKKIIARVNDN